MDALYQLSYIGEFTRSGFTEKFLAVELAQTMKVFLEIKCECIHILYE
jgi:hypothetical protein